MTELEQLREQVRAQEMDVLRLRAEKGEALTRVANLQRINDTQRNLIERLRARLRPDPEAAFKRASK